MSKRQTPSEALDEFAAASRQFRRAIYDALPAWFIVFSCKRWVRWSAAAIFIGYVAAGIAWDAAHRL